MSSPFESRSGRGFFWLTTGAAVALAYACFFWGGQGLFWDAYSYSVQAQTIAERGLFGFADPVHPYGYPLIVAFCSLFTNKSPFLLRFAVFHLQLAAYLAVCYYAARRLATSFPRLGLRSLYAAAALNPILIINTTEVLSDLLSAVLIFLAVAMSVPASRSGGRSSEAGPRCAASRCGPGAQALLVFFSASFAVMVRPANLAILAACGLLWVFRAVLFRDLKWSVLPIALAACALPAIPQVVNNWRAFRNPTPLIGRKLYSEQLEWGTYYLKYGTLVIPREPAQLFYESPFRGGNRSPAGTFARKQPLRYAATLAVHAFALFDQDFAFTYIVNKRPWYRWPLSLFGYSFLFLSGFGAVLLARSAVRGDVGKESLFAILALFVPATSYVSLYIPVAVENRFSIPVYLLLTPVALSAALEIRRLLSCRRWNRVTLLGSAALVFIAGCALLSVWIQRQAPLLR